MVTSSLWPESNRGSRTVDSMNMAARETILTALLRVLPEKSGIAVIHSSLADLVPPVTFSFWDALYALDALVRRGWTLALPAFTFTFCNGSVFSATKSRSEVGILSDALLCNFHDAVRTCHPIYSFAVIGPRASEILDCRSNTTFGDDSPFGLFEREQATVVMMGCPWAYNTQFHRYEEMAAVPYRYPKVFAGIADFGAGPQIARTTMWVRDLAADPINDFSPAVRNLRENSLIASAPLWRGSIEAASIQNIARICRSDLSANPYAYVANAAKVSHVLSQRAEANSQPAVRVAVLGSFNLHFLEQAWQSRLAELLPERRIEHYAMAFGQLRPEILDLGSGLHAFNPSIRVFCDRVEDVVGGDCHSSERAVESVREYAELIAQFHKSIGGWTIVHRFAAFATVTDVDDTNAARCDQLNAVLDEILGPMSGIVWVDVGAEAAAHDGAVSDPRLWYIGRFAFAQSFSKRLSHRWASLTLAILSKTSRVVVIDLDNTLWGGVLGEDGITGIKVGGDYPGNAFAAFQRTLKALPRRGILLAICSKNDEDMALQAIDELPSMVLRSRDISARRINWEPKWQNIQEIAAELNVGLDSVLFVDDNPVEREAVHRNLPGVKILDLPPDPAGFADTLRESPYLAVVTITAEDARRADDFKARKQRAAERTQSASLEDYYASLNMMMSLSPLSAGNVQRAAQLCQKTNQFNSTTRRYDQRQLEKLAESGADVIVIGLADRYSPAENIGLLVLVPEDETTGMIDLYLLSCRVLGRGIETAIPRWAIGRAAQRGWSRLRGEVIETERNMPIRNIFADAGFDADGRGRWITNTRDRKLLPAWMTIIDHIIP
jgi:FkbH-like protein